MAQAAFDYAVNYMKDRHVFGKPLASMQRWQYRFAAYATQLENAHNLYMKAALVEDRLTLMPPGRRRPIPAGATLPGAGIMADWFT